MSNLCADCMYKITRAFELNYTNVIDNLQIYFPVLIMKFANF